MSDGLWFNTGVSQSVSPNEVHAEAKDDQEGEFPLHPPGVT